MAVAPRRSTAGPSQTTMLTTSGYADVAELDRYKLVSNIGKGSFGVISKVQRVDDGREFAMKQLDYSKMTDKDRKQILAEVAILESLKHRNIVQLIQKIKDPKNERIYIVMEYCTSGDLGSLIRKAQRTGQPLHEDKIWNIFLQITLALHHCHWPAERPQPGTRTRLSGGRGKDGEADGSPRYQVLHRDLKPENVFLSDDFVKLGDFGLSKDMGNSAFTSTYVGTPLYMPPEILAENRYDTKSDIWSLGCLVFEMCALHSPFSTAQTQAELITMVKSGKLPPLPSHISPALTRVIRAMLNLNPVKRPTTKDLLEMDEMKLHRKLFTVQNQASILQTRKGEMKEFEERLFARSGELDGREKAVAAREASLQAREAACALKEEEVRETQKKLNQAVETLRGQWDRLREEKDRSTGGIGLGLPGVTDVPAMARRASTAPTRPLLEERATVPLPVLSRISRAPQTTYEDTPSKIPLASPPPSDFRPDSRFSYATTPLRRNATKSLGNLRATAAIQAERAVWPPVESTPAKQIFPVRHGVRTSIGSPQELRYSEDISMALATPINNAVGSPFIPRPRRSSVAPSAAVLAAASGSSSDSSPDVSPESTIAPTMIPAPAPSFTYREAATPAKWLMDDPDLPSPFVRRPSAAPDSASDVSQASLAGTRQPLGAISLQSGTMPSTAGSQGSIGKGSKAGSGMPTLMPRSRSGGLNLHRDVLKAQAMAVGETRGARLR